jgi:hypothetical protein
MVAQTNPQLANTYKIANEGDTISAGPATATLQAGVVGQNWTPGVTVTSADYPLVVSWANGANIVTFGPDPLYGVVKEIDAVETCVEQAFTVGQATVTVPALPATGACAPPAPPVATTPPVTTTTPSATSVDTNDAALIIAGESQQSMTQDELKALRQAVYKARTTQDAADAAKAAVMALEQSIVTAHNLDPMQPFQIVLDSSWTVSYTPPKTASTSTLVLPAEDAPVGGTLKTASARQAYKSAGPSPK